MSDSNSKGREVTTTSDKTVEVSSYTRKPPAMRGYDKVTVRETTTRTVTYEKKPRRG